MTEPAQAPEHPKDPPPLPELARDERPCEEHQYAAKVVSGIPQTDLEKRIVAAGRYFTAVNVHNPATCKTVTFRWKVTVALPVSVKPGVISRWKKATLRPDESVEIDSPNIHRILKVDEKSFIKGFVVVESPCPLDVVAVYTVATQTGFAGATAPESLAAFHTERVPGRLIEACRNDLKHDLGTGKADWQVIAATDFNGAPLPGISAPRDANVIEDLDKHPLWGTQVGSKWIGVRGTAKNPVPAVLPGFYTFQTCFSLCSGFESPKIDLSVLVDDSATVWLNETQVGAVAGFANPTTLAIDDPNLFLPGLNCLTFVVRNNHPLSPVGAPSGPVGLNVKGIVSAVRGACGGCGCAGDCGPHPHRPKPEIHTAEEAE